MSGNSLAGIGMVDRIGEVGEKENDEGKTEDLFGLDFEPRESIVETGVNDIDNEQPAEAKAEYADYPDTAMEIERQVAIIPPLEVLESFEVPAGAVFE